MPITLQTLFSVSISKRFHVSDTYAHDVFDRYVKLTRLPLTDALSVDEVFLEMDDDCKYALVIQDFHTGDPIGLLRSRRMNVTEPYFAALPIEERSAVTLYPIQLPKFWKSYLCPQRTHRIDPDLHEIRS